MSDNIIMQKLNNLFASTMNGILGEEYNLPATYIFVSIGPISFILHIVSLKTWFDNKFKNEKLLEMIQYLQTGNENLAEKIHNIENYNLNLIGKIQSLSIGYETLQNVTEILYERIHTAKTDNKNMFYNV